MKINIVLKDGRKINRNHVRYMSTAKNNNQVWLYRYSYYKNTRRSVEESFNLEDVEFLSASQPEKGGW